VHLLARLRQDRAVSDVMRSIKAGSSRWVHRTFSTHRHFAWQNGYAESFAGRFRDELLNAEVFADLREAKALSAMWRNDYNHRRPHSSLGYRTPAEFAASLAGPPLRLGAAPLACAAPQQATEHAPTLIATGT